MIDLAGQKSWEWVDATEPMQKQAKLVRRTRRMRKPRRADVLVSSNWNYLEYTAPEGRYEVDALTCELQACGWLVSGNRAGLQPFQLIQHAVNCAVTAAYDIAVERVHNLPRDRETAKYFFENLRRTQKSISALCKADPEVIGEVVHNHDVDHKDKDWPDSIDDAPDISDTKFLIKSLKKFNRHVETYLKLHTIPELRGGNIDWLGSIFIRVMANRGRKLMKIDGDVPPLQGADMKLFSTLLAAGWTDLKFPLKDHRGKSMEPLDLFFEVRVKSMLKANRL